MRSSLYCIYPPPPPPPPRKYYWCIERGETNGKYWRIIEYIICRRKRNSYYYYIEMPICNIASPTLGTYTPGGVMNYYYYRRGKYNFFSVFLIAFYINYYIWYVVFCKCGYSWKYIKLYIRGVKAKSFWRTSTPDPSLPLGIMSFHTQPLFKIMNSNRYRIRVTLSCPSIRRQRGASAWECPFPRE